MDKAPATSMADSRGVAGPRARSGSRVRGQVAVEQRTVREDFAAGGAGRALGPVRAHVHVERALLREALGADSALEGAHTRVRDHMLEQVIAQRERSPAHGALVGLLPCGRQGVPHPQSAGKGPGGAFAPQGLPSPPFHPEYPCRAGTHHSRSNSHSRPFLSNRDPHIWPGISLSSLPLPAGLSLFQTLTIIPRYHCLSGYPNSSRYPPSQ